MFDPKEIYIKMVDEAYTAFEDIHGRIPTQYEEDKISDICYEDLGDRIASMADAVRDRLKEQL